MILCYTQHLSECWAPWSKPYSTLCLSLVWQPAHTFLIRPLILWSSVTPKISLSAAQTIKTTLVMINNTWVCQKITNETYFTELLRLFAFKAPFTISMNICFFSIILYKFTLLAFFTPIVQTVFRTNLNRVSICHYKKNRKSMHFHHMFCRTTYISILCNWYFV